MSTLQANTLPKAAIECAEFRHLSIFNHNRNNRKATFYWIGFLEGVLASGEIEPLEHEPLSKEAEAMAIEFNNTDAMDFLEDLKARCHDSTEDQIRQLQGMIVELRSSIDGAPEDVDQINEFLGFCAGIICDGEITRKEFQALSQDYLSHSAIAQEKAFDDLRTYVETLSANRSITKKRLITLLEPLATLVGDGYADTGISSIGRSSQFLPAITDPSCIAFQDQRFVITGIIPGMTRAEAHDEIALHGGFTQDRVRRNTNFIVVSDKANKHWWTTHYGRKMQRAMKLIEEGYPIVVVTASAFLAALRDHSTIRRPKFHRRAMS